MALKGLSRGRPAAPPTWGFFRLGVPSGWVGAEGSQPTLQSSNYVLQVQHSEETPHSYHVKTELGMNI